MNTAMNYEIIRRKKLACAILTFIIANEEEQNNKRSVWVTPYLLRRQWKGMHHNLFMELALEDPNRFRRYFISNPIFIDILPYFNNYLT